MSPGTHSPTRPSRPHPRGPWASACSSRHFARGGRRREVTYHLHSVHAAGIIRLLCTKHPCHSSDNDSRCFTPVNCLRLYFSALPCPSCNPPLPHPGALTSLAARLPLPLPLSLCAGFSWAGEPAHGAPRPPAVTGTGLPPRSHGDQHGRSPRAGPGSAVTSPAAWHGRSTSAVTFTACTSPAAWPGRYPPRRPCLCA